ncbi:hypothetical protein FPRO06_13774 [Fusarium proliferatum]|nr:hypothetical protein FPRO06_13774 [Fusarium proliferatum]
MDGRLVTDSSSERGSSTTGDPNQSMPLRARILHLVKKSNRRNGNAGQNVKEIFLDQIWPKLESDYQRMSKKLAKACKAELSNRGVPIPVTVEHRVKSRTSISKSLQRREIHRTKENLGMYKSLHEIFGDLHDLVGIRIIVEYLDHLKDVSDFVTGSFYQERKPKRFHANRKVGHLWQPWFGAYECMNYHISSKYEYGNRLSIYNGVTFEIQVTSLPAHMYNKIAHPLLYKEEAGTLSQGDEMVIDITKGLAYCYSLCLHFKRSKQGGDVGKQDTELLRNISSPSGELDESSLNCLAGRIPKLDVAASKTMDIPRESLRLALDSLLNDQMPDNIGQALADRFSREIEDIAQPPINLVTSGNARFDSQDVFSSPVCQAGTQTRAIQYIHDWINDSQKALLWIYSHAGTGKSTLARTIARELTETRQIAAGYFLKRGDANRNDVSRVFPTIASQFMSTIPRYEPFLRKSVIASKNQDIKTMRLEQQFEVLLKGPLSEIGIVSSTKVIIIDALDECTNLLEASKIIKLLCSLGTSNVLRFRLLVTSRDESLVRKAIENQIHESLQLATTFRNDNISDIRSILRLGFEDIRKETEIEHAWPTDEQFEVILQRSINPSPLFIYAATFLRYLDEGKEMCTSEKRLQWWIDQSPSTDNMSQLEGLYTTVFDNLDRNKKDGTFGLLADEEKKDLRTVLSIVVLAVEPLSIEAIASISRVDLGTTRGLLKCCRAVLEISDDNQQPVKAVHKSFSDFLLRKDPLKRSWFHADEMESHDYIAEGCMPLLQTLRKDICNFNDPGVSRDSINPYTIDRHISKSLQYASSYWWYHLQSGNKPGPFYESLVPILESHLLHWIECLSILDRLTFASRAIRALCSSLIMGHPSESVRLLIPFLKDARRFILRHGDTIQENPLQTYGAALLFSPVESLIRRNFWETRHPGFRVIRNLEHHWGACLKKVYDDSAIFSISLSRDGQELAMAGIDRVTKWSSIWIRNTGAGTLLAQFETHTTLLALTWSCDGNSLLVVTEFGQVVRIDRAIETKKPFGFSPYATIRRYDRAAICPYGIASVVRVSGNLYGHALKSEVFTWKFTERDQTFRTWEFPDEDQQSLNVWRLPETTFERCLTVDLRWGYNRWLFTLLNDASKDKEAFIVRLDEATYIWLLEGTEETHMKHTSFMKLPIGELCVSSISDHREQVSKFGLSNLSYRARPHEVKVSMTDGRMAAISFKDTAEEPGNHKISAIALSPNSTYFAVSYGIQIALMEPVFWHFKLIRTALVHQREGFQQLFDCYFTEKPTPKIGLGESVGGFSVTSFQAVRSLVNDQKIIDISHGLSLCYWICLSCMEDQWEDDSGGNTSEIPDAVRRAAAVEDVELSELIEKTPTFNSPSGEVRIMDLLKFIISNKSQKVKSFSDLLDNLRRLARVEGSKRGFSLKATNHFHSESSNTSDIFIKALFVRDPRVDREDIQVRKGGLYPKSCNGILENATYKWWAREQPQSILWINGDPGKGKMMLICRLINELSPTTKLENQGASTVLSYFFCDANSSDQNDAISVLRGMIYLLIKQDYQANECFCAEFGKFDAVYFETKPLTFPQLRSAFVQILKSLASKCVYLIIDALDECIEGHQQRKGLQALLTLITKDALLPHVKWIVSSRIKPFIAGLLQRYSANINLEQNEASVSEAVSEYVKHKVQVLFENETYDKEDCQGVGGLLLSKAQSTFLWVALAFQMLENDGTYDPIRVLHRFPAGLDSLYGLMLKEVQSEETVEILTGYFWTTTISGALSSSTRNVSYGYFIAAKYVIGIRMRRKSTRVI